MKNYFSVYGMVACICMSLPGWGQSDKTPDIETIDAIHYIDDFSPGIKITGTAGLGTPYGLGLDLGYQFTNNTDVNIGAGLAFSGIKTGLGLRYIFFPSSIISPYGGFNITSNSGLNEVEISSGANTATYNIRSDISAYLRGGIVINLWGAEFFMSLGYGESLLYNSAELVSGTPSHETAQIASFMLPRGIEISASLRLTILRL